MNLYYFYPHIYWQTACLTVNASANEDNVSAGATTNYGKIAVAISNMQKQGVKIALPDINNADFGFKPDVQNDQIIFGLKAINGVGDVEAAQIIANRPYADVRSCIEKNTQFVTRVFINLIKAGAFDRINPDRMQVMRQYLRYKAEAENPPKESLNMQNFKSILALGILPEEFDFQRRIGNFRAFVNKKKVYQISQLGFEAETLFTSELESAWTEGTEYEYDAQGYPVIKPKAFEKWYKKLMEPVVEWVKRPETLALFNEAVIQKAIEDQYQKNCLGSIAKWEMDSLSFYYGPHALIGCNQEAYNISRFEDIPSEPEVVEESEHWTRYKLYRIWGTVLDKNKTRHTISLLTPSGVVNVKFYAGSFSNYDKQVSEVTVKDGKKSKSILEKSWFTRGTNLLITGYRRDDVFFPKTYRNSMYPSSVSCIKDITTQGLIIANERMKGISEDDI